MSRLRERCHDTRALLPEVALGIADGGERARALDHVSGCADCRRELDQLSAIADDLIELAPEREPPVGFEARVLKRLRVREKPRRARLSLRRLSFASGLVAAVAATALAMVLVYSDDHRLASQYRAALQGAHGQYFQSARLRAPGGGVAGTVFGYQGSPSWVFYVLNAQYRDGIYDEQIVTRTGRLVSLQPFRLVDGSWGVTTPIPLRDIARVRLVRRAGGPPLQAELPVVER